jgi:ribosomal protein L29
MAKKKENFKDMSVLDLKKMVASLQEEIREIRFKAEGSRSKNVKEVSNLKKKIAKILTEVNKSIKNK